MTKIFYTRYYYKFWNQRHTINIKVFHWKQNFDHYFSKAKPIKANKIEPQF